MKNTKAVLAMLALLCSAFHARSCSCFAKGRATVQDYNSYDWIFTGLLIGESEAPLHMKYLKRAVTYKVSQAFKGVHVGDTVVVYDA